MKREVSRGRKLYRILHEKVTESVGRRDELKSFRSQIVERNWKGEIMHYGLENKEDNYEALTQHKGSRAEGRGGLGGGGRRGESTQGA